MAKKTDPMPEPEILDTTPEPKPEPHEEIVASPKNYELENANAAYWRALLNSGECIYTGSSRKAAVDELLARGPGAVVKCKVHCRVEAVERLSIVR